MFEEFTFDENIDAETYMKFRESVGWGLFPLEEAEVTLKNSAVKVACHKDGKIIAICRALWDGGYTAYIADVIVDEAYRGQGLGKEMVRRTIEKIENQMKPGWKIRMVLNSAPGKEPFYEKFGFVKRPNEHAGCGMHRDFIKE